MGLWNFLGDIFGRINQEHNEQIDQSQPTAEDAEEAQNIDEITQIGSAYSDDFEIGDEIGTVPKTNPGQGPTTDEHPSIWKRIFG